MDPEQDKLHKRRKNKPIKIRSGIIEMKIVTYSNARRNIPEQKEEELFDLRCSLMFFFNDLSFDLLLSGANLVLACDGDELMAESNESSLDLALRFSVNNSINMTDSD